MAGNNEKPMAQLGEKRWLDLVPELEHFDPRQGLVIVDEERQARLAKLRLGFLINDHGILFPRSVFCEVLSEASISRIPNAPSSILGLTNVRGNLVPVFDFQLAYKSGRDPSFSRYMLVIDQGPASGAVFIDELPTVLNTDDSLEIVEPDAIELPDPLRAAMIACYREDETTWIEIDHVRLFESLGHH